MLSRLGPADSIVVAARVVRAERRYRALPAGSASQPGSTGTGGQPASTSPPPRYEAASSAEHVAEAVWSEADEEPSVMAAAALLRAQYIRDAYRATDPIQPRPGLYLHVRA